MFDPTTKQIVYKSIYAIDNFLDDNFDQWKKKHKDINGFVPSNQEEIANLGDNPCGLLTFLYKRSKQIEELLDNHKQFISFFNGISYLYGKTAKSCEELMDALKIDDKDRIKEARINYSKFNLHASCFCRVVLQTEASTKPYTLSDVRDNLKILFSDDFIRIHDPSDCNKNKIFLTSGISGSNRDSSGINNLFIKIDIWSEERDFIRNDIAETFADLDEEVKSGVPTANIFVNYFRAKFPDIDLLDIKNKVQKTFKKQERVSQTDLTGIDQTLASEAQAFFESYSLHERGTLSILTSLKEKQNYRNKVKSSKIER